MKAILGIGIAAVLVLAAGCAKPPTREQVDSLLSKARGLAEQGNTEGATRELESAFADRRYQPFKGELLQELVQLWLAGGQEDEARRRILETARAQPELAAGAIGLVGGYMLQRQEMDGLAEWCGQLAALPLPERGLLQVADLHVEALAGGTNYPALVTAVSGYLARLPVAAAVSLADKTGSILLRGSQFDAAVSWLELVEGRGATQPEWKPLANRLRMDLFTAQGQWEPAEEFFRTLAAQTPDAELGALFTRLAGAAARAGNAGVADRVCRFALTEVKDRPGLRAAAARAWLQSSISAKNAAEALGRLSQLLEWGVPAGEVVGLTDRAYGVLMEHGKDAEMKSLIVLCDALLKKASTEAETSSLKGIMLDACFRVDDLDRTVQLLESGIPGQDAVWHEMMINKVKAHQALRDSRKDEAVERFRKFMDYIRTKPEGQIDPTTGMHISMEMILGLNARRIGDILASANKAAEAAAEYKAAADYYRQALEKTKPGRPEYDRIQADLKDIPGVSTNAAGK